MHNFSNILTLIQPETYDLISLEKSILLAKNNLARVTVLSTKSKPSAFQNWLHNSETNNFDNKEQVHDLISFAKNEGVAINHIKREESDQILALKKQLEENKYDLIVADHQKDESRVWPFNNAEHSHLLNVSDTSVLFVGHHKWLKNGNVITAIETQEDTKSHRTFNNEIIEKSNDFAKLLMSDIHLFDCYLESCSVAFQEVSPNTEFQNHLKSLTSLVKAYHFEDKFLHVEEGLADDVIPSQASKYNANVVVMGCGEHKGLLSKIKGHTIDYVLDNLECDLLALKQSNLH